MQKKVVYERRISVVTSRYIRSQFFLCCRSLPCWSWFCFLVWRWRCTSWKIINFAGSCLFHSLPSVCGRNIGWIALWLYQWWWCIRCLHSFLSASCRKIPARRHPPCTCFHPAGAFSGQRRGQWVAAGFGSSLWSIFWVKFVFAGVVVLTSGYIVTIFPLQQYARRLLLISL